MTIELAQAAIVGGAKVFLTNWPEMDFLRAVDTALAVPNLATPAQIPTFTLAGYRRMKRFGNGGAGEGWLVEERRSQFAIRSGHVLSMSWVSPSRHHEDN